MRYVHNYDIMSIGMLTSMYLCVAGKLSV